MASFCLATAIQAAPIEDHFLNATVDSVATYDTTGQFIKVGSGSWYVIAGSYPRNHRRQANQRRRWLARKGLRGFYVYNTDNFNNLRGGLLAVMWGGFSYREAQAKLRRVKRITGNAYIKRAD